MPRWRASTRAGRSARSVPARPRGDSAERGGPRTAARTAAARSRAARASRRSAGSAASGAPQRARSPLSCGRRRRLPRRRPRSRPAPRSARGFVPPTSAWTGVVVASARTRQPTARETGASGRRARPAPGPALPVRRPRRRGRDARTVQAWRGCGAATAEHARQRWSPTSSPARPSEVNAAAIGRGGERAAPKGARKPRSQLPRRRRAACSGARRKSRGAGGGCGQGARRGGDRDEVAMELAAVRCSRRGGRLRAARSVSARSPAAWPAMRVTSWRAWSGGSGAASRRSDVRFRGSVPSSTDPQVRAGATPRDQQDHRATDDAASSTVGPPLASGPGAGPDLVRTPAPPSRGRRTRRACCRGAVPAGPVSSPPGCRPAPGAAVGCAAPVPPLSSGADAGLATPPIVSVPTSRPTTPSDAIDSPDGPAERARIAAASRSRNLSDHGARPQPVARPRRRAGSRAAPAASAHRCGRSDARRTPPIATRSACRSRQATQRSIRLLARAGAVGRVAVGRERGDQLLVVEGVARGDASAGSSGSGLLRQPRNRSIRSISRPRSARRPRWIRDLTVPDRDAGHLRDLGVVVALDVVQDDRRPLVVGDLRERVR